jgi:hypothetical protein
VEPAEPTFEPAAPLDTQPLGRSPGPLHAIAAAIAVAGGDGGLWAICLFGFLVRGGLLVILLPVLAVPSPVGLSIIVGPDIVDATGVSARVLGLVAGGLIILAVTVLVALVAAAAADLAAFRQVGRAEGWLAPASRPWRTLGGLAVVEAVALVPAVVALAVASGRVIAVGTQEVIFPSRLDVPFVVRVVAGSADALIVVAALLALADLANAVASRALLRRSLVAPSRPQPGRRPSFVGAVGLAGRWIIGAMAAWIMTGIAIAISVGLLGLGWDLANATFLVPTPAGLGLVAEAAGMAVGAIGLAASLVASLVVLAGAAAVRNAIWTFTADA